MNIETFWTLEAVLRTGTFAQAAAERNLTRSAVSMQMKQLEVFAGQSLFDRAGLYARPTPLARELVDTMLEALQRLEALRKRPGLAVEGVLKLGVIESMMPRLLPGALKQLASLHPRLEVQPVRGRSSTLTAAVASGALDAAVVAEPQEGGSSRLRWRQLFTQELVLIVPPDAPEASLSSLLRQYPWIRYDRKTVSGQLAAQYLTEQVGELRSRLEFDSATAILSMVSEGLGLALIQLPDPALVHSYPVRIVRLGRSAPQLQFSMVSRKVNDESRGLLALHAALRPAMAAPRRGREPEAAVEPVAAARTAQRRKAQAASKP